MARYHINPETQRPNLCSAKIPTSCLYYVEGEPLPPHFNTKEEARAFVEKDSKEKYDKGFAKVQKLSPLKQLEKDIYGKEPVEFDHLASDEYGKMFVAQSVVDKNYRYLTEGFEQIGRDKFIKKHYHYSRSLQPDSKQYSFEEVVELNNGDRERYDGTTLRSRWEASAEILKGVKDRVRVFNDVFHARGGWNRAFLVPNGHVHSSQNCGTCNKEGKATEFNWMIDYSNKSEEEIVEAAGYRACTVCYPSAPVGDEKTLPTKMFAKEELAKEEARREREDAKRKKEAERIAKAPTLSGEPLNVVVNMSRFNDFETFKTERTATTWYVDKLMEREAETTDEYNEEFPDEKTATDLKDDAEYKKARYKIAYHLALKHDKSINEIQDEFEKKAQAWMKKRNKSYRDYSKNGIDVYKSTARDSYDIPTEYLNVSPRQWDDIGANYAPE